MMFSKQDLYNFLLKSFECFDAVHAYAIAVQTISAWVTDRFIDGSVAVEILHDIEQHFKSILISDEC